MQKAVFPRSIYKRLLSCCSNVVYNIKLPFAYSEFTVQNQLLVGSFVGTTFRFYGWRAIFFLMHVLKNGQVWDDPTSVTHERFRRDFHNIWTSHPSLWIGAMQCNFWTDILDFFKFRFENFQREHLCTEVHVPFGEVGWNVSEYFSSEKDVQKWRGKKLWRKHSSKNFASGFLFYY